MKHPINHVSISQLADWCQTDRATVRNRLKDLTPVLKTPKLVLYDSVKALPLILKRPGKTDAQIKAARLRTKKASADSLELEVQKFKSENCHIEDIANIVKNEYDLVRNRLNLFPSQVAESIAKTDDPNLIYNILQDGINSVLTDLSEK